MHKKRGTLLLLIAVLLIFTPVLAQESGIEKCKNVKYRSLCYTLAAQAENNGDLCDEIADEYERGQCKEIVNKSNNKFFILVFSSALVFMVIIVIIHIINKKQRRKKKLMDYIRKAENLGYKDDQIVNHLKYREISDKEVKSAYKNLKK